MFYDEDKGEAYYLDFKGAVEHLVKAELIDIREAVVGEHGPDNKDFTVPHGDDEWPDIKVTDDVLGGQSIATVIWPKGDQPRVVIYRCGRGRCEGWGVYRYYPSEAVSITVRTLDVAQNISRACDIAAEEWLEGM